MLADLTDKINFYSRVSSCCMVDKCIACILDMWLGLLGDKKAQSMLSCSISSQEKVWFGTDSISRQLAVKVKRHKRTVPKLSDND